LDRLDLPRALLLASIGQPSRGLSASFVENLLFAHGFVLSSITSTHSSTVRISGCAGRRCYSDFGACAPFRSAASNRASMLDNTSSTSGLDHFIG